MTDQDERLTAIEKRLLRIEETLRQPPLAHQSPAPKPSTHGASPVNEFVANLAPQPDNEATTKPQRPSGVAETLLKEKGNLAYQNSKRRPKPGSAITTLMACGAALSFILAAAYFVGLAYKAGLLTPELQLGIALMSGLGLIVAGVVFAHRDRQYAAYMPAVGLIVLYLTVYAGHVHYHLIPDFAAMVIVAGISVGGILLGKRFDNSVYGVLAAAGVYVTPLLLGDVFRRFGGTNDLLHGLEPIVFVFVTAGCQSHDLFGGDVHGDVLLRRDVEDVGRPFLGGRCHLSVRSIRDLRSDSRVLFDSPQTCPHGRGNGRSRIAVIVLLHS